MKIQFKEKKYELVTQPYVYGLRLQCQIPLTESVNEIISDTKNAETITIYDNEDKVSAIYNGYSKRIAITIMGSIGIEFENTDIQAQIDALTAQVQTQETAIADLGDTVNSVSETNETQDNAINDLADAVNELSNTEV